MIIEKECKYIMEDLKNSTPQVFFKNRYRLAIGFCINGRFKDHYCLSYQSDIKENGYRDIIKEYYFKNPERALKEMFIFLKKVKGGFKGNGNKNNKSL